jgi:RimJ/RimL family protein N-acetyltransferase
MTGMAWQTTGEAAEFLAMAGPYLRRDRVRNTMLLTMTESMLVNPATQSLLGWWTDPTELVGHVAGAFLHTPTFPVVLTALPAAAAAELAAVTLAGRLVPGVNAQPEVAQAFAGGWLEANGGRVDTHRRQRLYRLAGLAPPDPGPAGAARIAADSDAELLTAWFTQFMGEVGDMGHTADQRADVRGRIGYGGFTIWETAGQPVAMAGISRQVAQMARLGPVYTPPEFRGRGYGGAVTVAASQRLIDDGAEDVVLFTDLANPVSNFIYQRIGYRAVEDRVVLGLTAD